jgi:hypothetical protein
MRNVLIAAFSLVAFAGSAGAAAPKHTWYNVNYGAGTCGLSKQTPEQTWAILDGPAGHAMGYSVDRISPDDVVKTPDGNIHVTITGKLNGEDNHAEFFTSTDACDKFVKDEGISPGQAPSGDIN